MPNTKYYTLSSHADNKQPHQTTSHYDKIHAIHETNSKKQDPATPNKKVDTK